MKLKYASLPLLLGLAITTITFAGISAFDKKEEKEVHAATDTTSLYASCEDAVQSGSLSSLWSNVKTAANTGYSKGSYASLWDWYWTTDKKSDGTLMDYYSNTTSYKSSSSQCGSYSGEGSCYNREHTIPKSWWGGSTSNQGCDIYIVIPTDGYVNNRRSAYPLGEVDSPTYSSNNGFSKLGPNTFSGYTGTVFEPNDQFKGDIARLHFYSRAKWTSVAMTSSEGSSTFSGSESTNYGLTNYGKNLFYKWHQEDPVDEWELQRNDRGQSVQGNRNPFIDHPEYVDYLWGGVAIGSMSSSTTAPTSMSISGNSKVAVGATTQLTVSVSPSDASKSVTWSSSSTSVATVSSTGVVTGVASGNVTITATSKVDSSIKATKSIQVVGMSNLTFTGTPTRTTYESSDAFEPAGLTVTASYTDGTSVNVTNDVVWGSLVAGQTSVQGSYGGFTITVTGLTITQAAVSEDANITFHSGSDSGTAIGTGTSALSDEDVVDSNDLVSSISEASRAYPGKSGLKLGSSGNSGSVTLAINTAKQASVSSITIESAKYGSDTGTLSLKQGSTTLVSSFTPGESKTHTFSSPTSVSSITIATSTKRAYLKSVTFSYSGSAAVGDSVTLDKASATIAMDETLSLTATASGTVTWSSSNTSVATVSNGLVTPVGTGNATITATCGEASATCTVTVTAATFSLDETSLTLLVGETSDLTTKNASGAVTWTSSDTSVATVSNGTVTAVAAGTATITATCGGQSATCSVKVKNTGSTSIVNSIEAIYNGSNGSSYSFYGLYVGNSKGSRIVMNGEYGVILYDSSITTSNDPWVENETYVYISGTRSDYKNLVEIVNTTRTVVTDQSTIDNNVEPVVSYKMTGSETYTDTTLASRLSIASGKITSLGDYSSGTSSDVNMTIQIGTKSFNLFLKKNTYSTSDISKLQTSYNNSSDITIQGFTSIYNTSFEFAFQKIIEADQSYTAELFASDLLELTNSACTQSQNNGWANVKSLLSSTWITLEGENYYAKLPSAQKAILVDVVANDSGTTLQRAMARYDHIVARYGLNNFIDGRSVSPLVKANPIISNTDAIIPIIVIISLIGVSAIGAFFYIRKRKEN